MVMNARIWCKNYMKLYIQIWIIKFNNIRNYTLIVTISTAWDLKMVTPYRTVRIRRLVLDVLKLHQPRIDVLAYAVAELSGVESVNIIRTETDSSTEGITVTIVGDNLIYKDIEAALKDYGSSIHSVDEVVAGENIIDTVPLPAEEEKKI